MLSVATFLGLAAFIVEEPAPVARTPFGAVPEGCTVEVPHGTHVEEDAQGLRLSHPTLGTWHHAAPSHCSEPLRRRRHASSITCDSLPCNNWIDNAGWQQPTGATATGGFSSNYVVPATPKKPWGDGAQGKPSSTSSAPRTHVLRSRSQGRMHNCDRAT